MPLALTVTGQFSLAYSTADAVAYRLFNDWNNDADALISNAGRDVFRKETTSVDAARLNQLFATCRANTVLGVTGHEGMIRQALRKSWPQAN